MITQIQSMPVLPPASESPKKEASPAPAKKAANYLSLDTISLGDKARIFFGATGAGGLAAGTVATLPAGLMLATGALLKNAPLKAFSEATLLSAVASGAVVGVLSSQVYTGKQGAILGAVVGTSVGAAVGALKGGLTGALVNGAIGGASGLLGGYVSSAVHSGYEW